MDRSQFHAASMFVIYRDIFEGEIQLLEQYIIEVADVFDRKSIELNSQYSPEIEGYQLNAWEQEYFKNALDFPKVLNASILIGMYSIFEKTLKSICDLCKSVFNPAIVPKQKKGSSYMEHYAGLLCNTYKITSAGPSAILKGLNDYRVIRNVFVHSNGNIRRERSETKDRIHEIVTRSDKKLLLNEHIQELIIHDNQWLIGFSQKIQTYLRPVFEELIQKHTILIKSHKKKP